MYDPKVLADARACVALYVRGGEPGSFFGHLLDAFMHADTQNWHRLQRAFPEVAQAIHEHRAAQHTTVPHEPHRDHKAMQRIDIYCSGAWTARGFLVNGKIHDGPLELEGDPVMVERVYEAIEQAISDGDSVVELGDSNWWHWDIAPLYRLLDPRFGICGTLDTLARWKRVIEGVCVDNGRKLPPLVERTDGTFFDIDAGTIVLQPLGEDSCDPQ